MARRTSPMGITPSFSPSMGSLKSANASLISASSRAVMLCSLASLDWRGLGVAEAAAADGGALRFAGFGEGGGVRVSIGLSQQKHASSVGGGTYHLGLVLWRLCRP